MILVWVGDDGAVGSLDRTDAAYVFAYDRTTRPEAAVSLTMPVTLESYDYNSLHAIFQMNQPEGSLREAIMRRFRKAIPHFDDLDMLALMGSSQIGRLRYSNQPMLQDVPAQSIKEILRHPGTDDLMDYLLDRFTSVSGVSGAQPKVLVRDDEYQPAVTSPDRITVRGATHLVKTFDQREFPELAANEFFCMRAAERAGLAIPKVQLSDNGRFLVVERFDLAPDGHYLGFEDFCSLNALGTDHKYDFSYETLANRIGAFVSPPLRRQALETYFRSLALSCAVQNGDAHLKNFGVLYENAEATVSLSPAFDIVSTTPYIRGDSLALTLDDSKRFPTGASLVRFARTQCGMKEADARAVLQQIADALADTRREVLEYIGERAAFKEVGERMLAAWEVGSRLLADTAATPAKRARKPSGKSLW